ncbi:MAG: hypothetical protein Q4D45_03255 [Lachnospiraceae bacterium]|nr:hypothetical protein [Lachnospiraceae bacterium]
MKKIRIDKSKEEWIRSLEEKVELLGEGEDFLKEDECGLYLEGKAKHTKGLIYYIFLIFIFIITPGFEFICDVSGMDILIECFVAFVFVNVIFFLQGRFVIRNMLSKLRQI